MGRENENSIINVKTEILTRKLVMKTALIKVRKKKTLIEYKRNLLGNGREQ